MGLTSRQAKCLAQARMHQTRAIVEAVQAAGLRASDANLHRERIRDTERRMDAHLHHADLATRDVVKDEETS